MANQLVATVISDILESNQDEDFDYLMEVLEKIGFDVRYVPLETAEGVLSEEVTDTLKDPDGWDEPYVKAYVEERKPQIINLIGEQTNIVFANCLLAAKKLKALTAFMPHVRSVYWGCKICVFDNPTRSACHYILQNNQKQNHLMQLKYFIEENFKQSQ